MNENFFPRCGVYATIAWIAVFVFITASWAVMFVTWRLAFLLGGTGCVLASVACALTVRSFMVRLAAMIRATRGLDSPPVRDGLHSIR